MFVFIIGSFGPNRLMAVVRSDESRFGRNWWGLRHAGRTSANHLFNTLFRTAIRFLVQWLVRERGAGIDGLMTTVDSEQLLGVHVDYTTYGMCYAIIEGDKWCCDLKIKNFWNHVQSMLWHPLYQQNKNLKNIKN